MPGFPSPPDLGDLVYTCSNCHREVARGKVGAVPPVSPPATCLYCGVTFINGVGAGPTPPPTQPPAPTPPPAVAPAQPPAGSPAQSGLKDLSKVMNQPGSPGNGNDPGSGPQPPQLLVTGLVVGLVFLGALILAGGITLLCLAATGRPRKPRRRRYRYDD
jgi:hypothetical protein